MWPGLERERESQKEATLNFNGQIRHIKNQKDATLRERERWGRGRGVSPWARERDMRQEARTEALGCVGSEGEAYQSQDGGNDGDALRRRCRLLGSSSGSSGSPSTSSLLAIYEDGGATTGRERGRWQRGFPTWTRLGILGLGGGQGWGSWSALCARRGEVQLILDCPSVMSIHVHDCWT
jgi:hypothetical protein